MKIIAFLALALATRVVAQSASTEPETGPESSASPVFTQSDPPISETPTPTISGPRDTETSTTSITLPTPSATSPVGGGATCVQSCLAKAASQAGCTSSADVPCICQSRIYASTAQSCFSDSACENGASQSAIGDYGTVCRNGNTSSETNQSSRPTSPIPSRTKSYSGRLASPTTQTIVITSGAVVTLPGGSATTIVSGYTTTRTGQAGDFADGGAMTPDPGAGNGATVTRPTVWGYGGGLVVLGIIGGALVFLN
ncbi:unnamed protein product [Rhizoctonia solani]|uniref:CFEM domain-containing protein n=1 Tax=Rhizoctonia solani TaxID=456999 RepID=A0A8H3E873_9AGAM|nr:unnamed protein product [Rhizoctonia solani]